MPNPKLASRLITERKTPDAARWISGQFARLIEAAPKNSVESKGKQYKDKLDQAIEFYMAHRAQTDTYRQLSHTQLIDQCNNTLHHLYAYVQSQVAMPLPMTEEGWDGSVGKYIAYAKWRFVCDGCGGVRPDISNIDGKNFCTRCQERYCHACMKCRKVRHADFLQYYTCNDTQNDYQACPECAPKTARCACCGNHYMGGEARPRVGIEFREVVEIVGDRKICWKCAGRYQRMECGHVGDRIYKIHTMPNVEDDLRDREEVRTEVTTCCHKCMTEHEDGDEHDIEYFNPKKPKVTSKSYKEVGSKRSFGVELELVQAKKMKPMPESIKHCWTSKADASLPGEGVELASTILYGDQGLKTIEELCEYAAKHKWSVDARAGFHLHVGLVDETPEQVGAVAMGYLQTYEMWASFVAPSRVRCKYCRRHKLTPEQAVALEPNKLMYQLTTGEGSDPGGHLDHLHWQRRVWCNWLSYLSRATVEIRFHHATKDYTKVANWVKAHTRFVDWCVAQGTPKAVYDRLVGKSCRQMFLLVVQEAWKDRELGRWFRGRMETLHGDCAFLPASNRKLRKKGIDPAAPRKTPETALTFNRRRLFAVSDGAGRWLLADNPRGDNYFINSRNEWDTSYFKWPSRAAAWEHAKLLASGMAGRPSIARPEAVGETAGTFEAAVLASGRRYSIRRWASPLATVEAVPEDEPIEEESTEEA